MNKGIESIKLIMLLIFVFCVQCINAQDGLQFYSDQSMEGYTLYESDSRAVLIDNCGNLINEWEEVNAQYHPKLLPNGNLVYIEFFSNDIVEKDWNDNTVNRLAIDADNIRLDYEVIVMASGNYLCLARKSFSQSQFEALGFDYGNPLVGEGLGEPSRVDMVVELDRDTGSIVWQWDISDHVIQERDPSKGNYGVLADHPELLNMDGIAIYDWQFSESFMINGFDYNPVLDQIVLSVRKLSEIVIIDHSTTTQEAAGHTGGNSGKGGDILYRWGNPQNYGQGDIEDRYLFFQHNPNWIQYGPHKGKLIMYNNGLNRPGLNIFDDYSTVPIIDPPMDDNGNYILANNSAYGPTEPEVDYSKLTTNNDFFSQYTSAAKVLQNGNVLITVGGDNRVMELLPDGTVVWEYQLYESNLTFRVEKYASDYPAFAGRDLTPGDVVEFPPSTVPCTLVGVEDTYFESTNVWATAGNLILNSDILGSLDMRIYSIDGKLMHSNIVRADEVIDISMLRTGIYIVTLKDKVNGKMQSYKVYR